MMQRVMCRMLWPVPCRKVFRRFGIPLLKLPHPGTFSIFSFKRLCFTKEYSLFGDQNIVLMGPPGAGKTTVGRIIGEKLDWPFIDVDDDVLEKTWNMSVAEKLKEGPEQFLEEEGQALLKLSASESVISLTGSNPMHSASMHHVKKNGIIVFLDVPVDDIINRLEQMKVDRIVGQGPGISLREILLYRQSFYKQWYDIRVLCESGEAVETIAKKVLIALKWYQNSEEGAFISSRSISSETVATKNNKKNFSDVIIEGLAPNGGLYVPVKSLPKLTSGEWLRLVSASYVERAQILLERCIHPSDVPAVALQEMITAAYGDNFFCPKIAPVRHLMGHQFLLELFHGPTASFKDLALQLFPLLYAYCIPRTCNYLILAATSGDTGSAVLDGFSRLSETDKQRIAVLIFFPETGISMVQKFQMISYQQENIQALGVESDFDFCQTTVKQILTEAHFTGFLAAQCGTALSIANSINWARLLPQIVYHASAYLDLVNQNVITFGDHVDVCIPTGNFGNILAAVYAKLMGIPIRKFYCASNQNHILTDFMKTGRYDLRGRKLVTSISPATDILKSSNLERYVHLISNGDGMLVKELYTHLENHCFFELPEPLLKKIQDDFLADWCSEEDCLAAIHSVYRTTGYILDTHTAIAKVVADRLQDGTCPIIISCTAHYSKFLPAVLQALKFSNLSLNPAAQIQLLDDLHLVPSVHLGVLEALKREAQQKSKVCSASISAFMDQIEAVIHHNFMRVK
ncbi:threonine synthase-like 1 [Protopterus annectens]|uniref:threonine synthase-like 1 n=1 Tax=Protopterus annectens TaxID=7888 RepID=UPI001CFA3E3D|nr:threonine synthase-like 1 [Protopterus annectens]